MKSKPPVKDNQEALKQGVIPDGRGCIPVQGYEEQVKKFKTNLRFFEQLENQVQEAKILFRTLAAQVVDKAMGEVRRVEFLAEDGSVVPVTLPDVTKAGNRTVIKPDLVSELAKLGVGIDELGVTETESIFVLSGPFVQWFRESILAPNYTAHGLAIPEGIVEKTTTKISEEGVKKLREVLASSPDANAREAARLLLHEGIKSASVTAK